MIRSRYDFMSASSVQDPVDGMLWPDPLTLNYNVFKTSERPDMIELGSHDIEQLWLLASKYYGNAEYDDVLLSLNGIAHKNMLKEGDVLYIPVLSDITTSFRATKE